MLSLEYLFEEAKNNGLPITKKRGVLREYLQIIILNTIYRHTLGKKIYFTGGTALRYFHNMPRFSEDLDFDTKELTYKEFIKLLYSIKNGLSNEGFTVKVSSSMRGKLYIAELQFQDILNLYNITDIRGMDLMIKLEIYRPLWKIESESDVLSLYGYNFSGVLLAKKCLFAEKLCALMNRRRGRDIYDTLFLLKKRFPIDRSILEKNNITGSPKETILKHLSSLTEKELKFLANQVKPFFFREEDTTLIINAVQYAEKFLQEYPNT